MKATRKRLQDIESSLGPSEEHSLRVEFYDISPDGEEIRRPGQSDNRPAKKVLRVRFDYRGANGRELWKERLASLPGSAQADGRGAKRVRNSADLAAPGESVVRDSLQTRRPHERGDGRRVRRLEGAED